MKDIWPISSQIGWTVETAGIVDLDDIYPKSGRYNYGNHRLLPTNTRAILKDIVDGKAYLYDDRNGVMMMPVELLKPVGR